MSDESEAWVERERLLTERLQLVIDQGGCDLHQVQRTCLTLAARAVWRHFSDAKLAAFAAYEKVAAAALVMAVNEARSESQEQEWSK